MSHKTVYAHPRTLMVQGTTSDAGKSIVVAGLCRVLHRRGISVAPFKPQNMALNSAVTPDGGEIGRAQALQAQAAGIAPTTDMNPVLLKPTTDIGAQVILHGKAIGNWNAVNYHALKPDLLNEVLLAHQQLSGQYEWIIVEGAGSPAEINLRDNDIANMGFAETADCPVIIVADIDQGGVFASLVGTLELLSKSEQNRVEGFIINRFRGDLSLLESGLEWLEKRTGKPVLGVLPYLHDLQLDAEDALPRAITQKPDAKFRIIAPTLPRISNHTDFDPLIRHQVVDFQFIQPNVTGNQIPSADLIILPGSKNTIADLYWLRETGWETAIQKHLRYGGKVLGICGGFQMLGKKIHDPHGIEGKPGTIDGFNLLEMETTLEPEKSLQNCAGQLCLTNEASISGYEIHAGRTVGAALQKPLIQFEDRMDGAISNDNQIAGCYLHGLFDQPKAANALLRWAGLETEVSAPDLNALREQSLEQLADAMEKSLDLEKLLGIL